MTEKEYIKQLKARLNKELIETLIEAARIFGWEFDLHETWSFIRRLDSIAETKLTIKYGVQPYEDTNKDYWD